MYKRQATDIAKAYFEFYADENLYTGKLPYNWGLGCLLYTSVTLKNEQGTTKIVKDAGMEILGAAFKELPDDVKKQLNLGYGLQVTGVSSGKMSDAGVRKGFIILKANDQPMRKVSDLEEVMKAAVKSPNQVLFLTGVFPSGKRGYFAVDLTQE